MHNYWITSQSSLNPWKEDQLEWCTYFPIYKLRKRECYFTSLNWTPYQIPGKQIHPTKNSGVFSWWLFYYTFDPKKLSSFPGEEIFIGRFLSGDQNNHKKKSPNSYKIFPVFKKTLVIFVWYRGWFILPNIYFVIICNKPILVRIPIYIHKPIRISWFMSFPGFLRLLPLRFTWPDSRWPISGELEPIGPWGSNRLGSSVPARRVNGGGVKQKIPGGFSWVFPKNRGFHPKSSKF